MREALLVFILGFSAVLSGCGGNGSNTASNAPVLTSISVTAPSANITASVTWISSDSAVATISDASPTKGLALGVSAGNTTVTASSGSISGTATLTVTSATSTSLLISPSNANLPLDVSQQFTATAT